MKLSIAMIAEEFKDYNIDCYFHQYDHMLSIERFKFYDGDLKLHSDTIRKLFCLFLYAQHHAF